MDMRRKAKKLAKSLIKVGRRTYGGIYELGGQDVYLAWRKTAEVFRGGEKTLSDAVENHKASWAMDNDTLIELRVKGVKIVGVWVMDTDDKFLAPIDAFFDQSRAKMMNFGTRGGALQRYLPLEHFHIRAGTTKIK